MSSDSKGLTSASLLVQSLVNPDGKQQQKLEYGMECRGRAGYYDFNPIKLNRTP